MKTGVMGECHKMLAELYESEEQWSKAAEMISRVVLDSTIRETEEELEQALTDAVTCTILAGAGSRRSEILATLYNLLSASKLGKNIRLFISVCGTALRNGAHSILNRVNLVQQIASRMNIGDQFRGLIDQEVIQCTSDSCDFINMPFDLEKSTSYLDITATVTDTSRKIGRHESKEEELDQFLSDCSVGDRFRGIIDQSCRSEVLNLKYKLCLGRILDRRRRFLFAALCYYGISQIEQRQIGGEETEEELEQALTDAVTCTILAGAWTQRSEILDTLYNLLSASKLGKNISFEEWGSLIGVPPHKGLISCTSDSFDFLNLPPYSSWRSTSFLDISIAVIDSNKRVDRHVSKEGELKFLGANCGLVDYKFMGSRCFSCAQKRLYPDPNSQNVISAHGYFCASIILSRRIPSAKLRDVNLGSLRGLHKPPKLALYPIGCPLCPELEKGSEIDAISAAIEKKVKVISMSLAHHLPCDAGELHPLSRAKEFKIIEAIEHDILTVLPAGNKGRNGLASLAVSGPWSLTVASCSSSKKYGVCVKFFSSHGISVHETEVDSLNVIRADQQLTIVRISKKVMEQQPCYLYLKNDDGFVFEPSSDDDKTPPPCAYPIVHFSSEESMTIYKLLSGFHSRNERVYVTLTASERKVRTEPPFVSHFSSKGPCEVFRDFMKPDVCAPGEEIAASWPKDEPLGGFGPPLLADYNIINGTSFAVPHAVAVAATVRAERPDFSATATMSAMITSAKRMSGDTEYCEFAYGAGIVDLDGAMKPGLVYEETAANYRAWFVDMLKHNMIFWFSSHCKLNLPYLSARVPETDDPWNCIFHRRVKSVETDPCSYTGLLTVTFTTLQPWKTQVKATICPQRLEFKSYGDVKDFTVKITLPQTKGKGLLSGSLTWTNDNTGLIVRSPVLLFRLNF